MDNQQDDSVINKLPSIELWPPNVLQKIVKKIPLNLRWNQALVSKDFYGLVCKADRFKYKISIKGDQMLNDVYESIMNSKRIFDEIRLWDLVFNERNLKILANITAKHGSTIKKFEFYSERHDDPREVINLKMIQDILENMPNLKDLDFYSHAPLFEELIGNPVPVLKNLKELCFCQGGGGEDKLFDPFVKFIEPDTTEKFTCYTNDHERFNDFFKSQRNIKEIIFHNHDYRELANPACLEHLKLESISIHCTDEVSYENERQLINDHAEALKKIRFNSVDESLIEAVCSKCSHLVCLSLTMSDNNVESLLGISQLKELKDLRVRFDPGFGNEAPFSRFDVFEDITKLKLPKLKRIALDMVTCEMEIQKKFFTNIGMNWRKVESLEVTKCFVPINFIMECMKNLKTLIYEDSWMFAVHYFSGKKYPFIQKLKLTKHNLWISNRKISLGAISSLPHVSKAFPNIRSLEIESNYNSDLIFPHLIGLKRLKQAIVKISVKSPDLLPNEADVKALKELCQRAERFYLKFSAPESFQFVDQLASLLEGEKFIIKKWMNHPESRNYRDLIINIKY